MIVSASRRTDIPAFYSDWFFNRLQAGFSLVRNPMNAHQVSRISLNKEAVDCFVFWTKNPTEMLNRHSSDLKSLESEIPFYFQFTINPYDKTIEPGVPEKKQLFDAFIQLSKLIGKEKVIWRYDPIIFTDKISSDYHVKYFEYIAKILAPYTNKCVISFLDFYKKTERNMAGIDFYDPSLSQKLELSKKLFDIASSLKLKLVTCAEMLDLSAIGIRHGQCIDSGLIAYLCGGRVLAGKDKNQRKECGCIESVDIGAYNTCRHGCLYCYANFSTATVVKQCSLYNPNSPLLFGEIEPEDKITEKKMPCVIDRQQELL